MNTLGQMQSDLTPDFKLSTEPIVCSYLDEWQENEIHLLYLHYFNGIIFYKFDYNLRKEVIIID